MEQKIEVERKLNGSRHGVNPMIKGFVADLTVHYNEVDTSISTLKGTHKTTTKEIDYIEGDVLLRDDDFNTIASVPFEKIKGTWLFHEFWAHIKEEVEEQANTEVR